MRANNVAIIPAEATASAIRPSKRRLLNSKLIMKVFLVLSGASKERFVSGIGKNRIICNSWSSFRVDLVANISCSLQDRVHCSTKEGLEFSRSSLISTVRFYQFQWGLRWKSYRWISSLAMNVWSRCGVRYGLARYLCASSTKIVDQIMLISQKIKIQRSKQNLRGPLLWESCPNGNRLLTDRMFYRPAEEMDASHYLQRIDF